MACHFFISILMMTGLSVFRKWVGVALAVVFVLDYIKRLVSVDLIGKKNQVILE